MSCHHQATAAARVRWLTTAQFAWLASSASAQVTGSPAHYRCAPLGPHLIQHSFPWGNYLACSSHRRGSQTPLHFLAFCPVQDVPCSPVNPTYNRIIGPFSLALAPCRDLRLSEIQLTRSGIHLYPTSGLSPLGYSACATPPTMARVKGTVLLPYENPSSH